MQTLRTSAAAGAGGKLNLAGLSILIVQPQDAEMEILAQTLASFGVWSPLRCASSAQADAVLASREVDLIVADGALSPVDGFEFVRALRNSTGVNRAAPVILVASYVRNRDMHRARNCGASFVMLKPLTPLVLYKRIVWLARDHRAFVEAPGFCGPDRRTQKLGPPAGAAGRRKDDLSAEVGAATEPNMSQTAIDDMFSPQRVSL